MSNYTPSAVNNSIEILFSIENNPYINAKTEIMVKFPNQYQFSKINCSHIFSKEVFNCVNDSNGRIKITDYFSNKRTSPGGEVVFL